MGATNQLGNGETTCEEEADPRNDETVVLDKRQLDELKHERLVILEAYNLTLVPVVDDDLRGFRRWAKTYPKPLRAPGQRETSCRVDLSTGEIHCAHVAAPRHLDCRQPFCRWAGLMRQRVVERLRSRALMQKRKGAE